MTLIRRIAQLERATGRDELTLTPGQRLIGMQQLAEYDGDDPDMRARQRQLAELVRQWRAETST